MRFRPFSFSLVLVVVLAFVLFGCQTQPVAAVEARQVVADFLQAGQAGDIDAAYALVINVRSTSGTFVPGPEFIRTIMGPDAARAADNKKRMAETVRANYAAIAREVKTVDRDTGSQAEQYWVMVEEATGQRVGQMRYLVVRAEAGWRLDLARSDFSQALVLEN